MDGLLLRRRTLRLIFTLISLHLVNNNNIIITIFILIILIILIILLMIDKRNLNGIICSRSFCKRIQTRAHHLPICE